MYIKIFGEISKIQKKRKTNIFNNGNKIIEILTADSNDKYL